VSAVTTWSLTPSDNNSAPPNGWPEGQAAASVNNCARQMMADLAREFQVNAVKVLASVAGTNTITGSLTPDLASYSPGMLVVFTPANNNTGATTLNIDSLGALDIQKADGDALVSGDLVAGIPALVVLDSGSDDWILLNPQTFNGVGLTLSGNASIGGTLSVTGALTLNGALTTDNTTADEAGFKGIPQNSQTGGGYTCVLADAGKHVLVDGSTTGTVTIPANASVAYPVGTALTFANASTTTSCNIAITSDTLCLAGTTTTGTRTLGVRGLATAVKLASTFWFISGTGLS
jgi:hypothetical protein